MGGAGIVVSLGPYLPPHLVRSLVGRSFPTRLPCVERFPAALLLSDVSGFTALTERLQARGREGAEEIAAAINAAFAPAIGLIEEHGGSIVSFGGDALFAIFPAVRHALTAAEAIRDSFARFGRIETRAGPVQLGISQAVQYGLVRGVHVGTEARRHYLVVGRAVTALARLEARASGGKLLVSPTARRRLALEPSASRSHRALGRASSSLLRPYVERRILHSLGKFEGEYRRVAVLFLETKVGSASALQRLYLALVETLDRTEGLLLKTDLSAAGTKWMCVFGIPRAHEEAADRAGRAALGILRSAAGGPALRGGLHTGVTANLLVGTRSRRCFDVMGDAVNTAARILAQAAWGEILVTEETRRLLVGVETIARGTRSVKGKGAALDLHALQRACTMVRQIRVSAPLIGRDAELGRIVEALERAKTRHGSAIGVQGEPGLGKSRLKYEAAIAARRLGFDVHEGRALSFGGMAYWTIGALLRDALGLSETAGKDEVLATVAASAERLNLGAVDRHHLADVLGVRGPRSPLDQLPPRDIRLNAMMAIRAFATASAEKKPRLLVLEDMHWADGASAEAADWLARGSPDAAMVLLLLYRPGYQPPESTVEIVLRDLDSDAVDALLEAHLGKVSAGVARLIRERAGGNPFYVEEVVRHLLESGIIGVSDEGYRLSREVRAEDLPEGVETLIAARVDRLATHVKRVAQHAAVIGRSFSVELLEQLPDVGRRARAALEELCRREIVTRPESGRGDAFTFRHALIRDVVYSSMLMASRRRLHGVVVEALERGRSRRRTPILPVLAMHHEQAGHPAEARRCYLWAARAAVGRHARDEAEMLYRARLRLFERCSVASVGTLTELIQRVLLEHKRPSDVLNEAQQALADARRLRSRRVEAACLHSLALIWGRLSRGNDVRRALRAEIRLTTDRDEAGRMRAIATLAGQEAAEGRFRRAQALYGKCIAFRRRAGLKRQEALALGNLANVVKRLGDVDRARRLYGRALRVATAAGDEQQQARILNNLGLLWQQRGARARSLRCYERSIEILRRIGDRAGEVVPLGNLGTLLFEAGDVPGAIERHDASLTLSRRVEDRIGEGIALGNLGDILRHGGSLDQARLLLVQALENARSRADRSHEAHLLVRLATLEIDAGRRDAAALRLGEAIEISQPLGDPSQLATANLARARHERYFGSPASAEAIVRLQLRRLRTRAPRLRAQIQIELIHARLAQGALPRASMVERLLDGTGLGPGSELASAAARAREAVDATRRGVALVRGECERHLSASLRSALIEPRVSSS